MVFFRFSAVKGGWRRQRVRLGGLPPGPGLAPAPGWGPSPTPLLTPLPPKEAGLADPVSMSYIRAPRLHQSTARLWPLRTRISGALAARGNHQSGRALPGSPPDPWSQPAAAYMYSMVPQKVWVTAPSWIDSLHRPKSVSLMWPEEDVGGWSGPRATGGSSALPAESDPAQAAAGAGHACAPWPLSMMFSGLRSR